MSAFIVSPESITTSKAIADEIFESTGFDYEINEQENDDYTVTLTFDSPKDAAKFKKMAETPISEWEVAALPAYDSASGWE